MGEPERGGIMREAIERVIAELSEKQTKTYKVMNDATSAEDRSFWNGYIDGINLSLHKIKEVQKSEPNPTDQQHAAKPE
jgi:hypothetical protein